MLVEKRLYSHVEVGQIIKDVVHDIALKMADFPNATGLEQESIMKDWAVQLLPMVEDVVVEEIVRRHVQGITLAVWAGPPGSGKGTNIDAVNLLGKVYAEVASQGVARILEEPYHSMLMNLSVDETLISTGTRGMFNRPEGEYVELFGELVPVVGKLVTDGGFVPDSMVSVLVELMILYRLTKNFHKIQIDLWPRTRPQFIAFEGLVAKVKSVGGKISQEVVAIKVLNAESMQFARKNKLECAEQSRKIALRIGEMLATDWYKSAQQLSQTTGDQKVRFEQENIALNRVFEDLEKEFQGEIGNAVIDELRAVCQRMAYRFSLVIEKGEVPRADEFPLSIIRRLTVYTGETAPVFLEELVRNTEKEGFYLVSSAGTPAEVVAEILDTLSLKASDDLRWQNVKKVAGDIAESLVARKDLIVDELVQRVGGILNS